MKREIKFRAKKLKDNIWVYGLLTNDMKGHYRINFDPKSFSCVVKEDTISQYTGLKDNNGKEIYEGDIVKFHFMTFSVSTSELFPTKKFFGVITTNKYNQWVILSDGLEIHIENAIKHGEVVGNIYDNKDLLKE